MQQILTELIVLSAILLLAALAFFFKPRQKDEKDKFEKNLNKFANLFNTHGSSFNQICKNLHQSGQIKIINSKMSVDELIEILGKENFKDRQVDAKPRKGASIGACIQRLKNGLAIGIYAIKDDEYYAFLCDEIKLFVAIDLANHLGENIIFCD